MLHRRPHAAAECPTKPSLGQVHCTKSFSLGTLAMKVGHYLLAIVTTADSDVGRWCSEGVVPRPLTVEVGRTYCKGRPLLLPTRSSVLLGDV
jgi:hypothetical protein